MPASGDQHQPWANPFEEKKARVSEWTAREIATMASKLDKQLGPEYISSRSGPGGSLVHYLTAEKCIGLANEVFGFNGWSSSIQNIQVDFADENAQTQRVSIGLSVIVRVTLRDGTYHEDIGYGSIENARGKAMAFEKAKKEGTTDGLKRALRSFGNVLGNCIYDKDYVKQVTKVKAQPVKRFDQDNLHRHADFAARKDPPVAAAAAAAAAAAPPPPPPPPPLAVKAEPLARPPPAKAEMVKAESFEDFLGELDENDFCVSGDGYPDEIVLPPLPAAAAARPPDGRGGGGNGRFPHTPTAAKTVDDPSTKRGSMPPHPPQQQQQKPAPQQPPPNEPVAFLSARSVSATSEATGPKHLFNPKAESPSIRKTAGIDHSSSRPVARNGTHVEPAPSASQSVTPGKPRAGNAVEQARRIGAPGGAASPLANRGSYKPPSMKRPLGGRGRLWGMWGECGG
ncbi:DNA repair and recombination protein rhm52 [Ophiocordyceps camponoti-floridani]|uniref:RAD52 homolog n=1 Tax=Ophiocordyceps camponoti-floridani TaxID=2030778 RepID=A0A8H4Q3J2_9HYPO|nr:DNA repair and recombination protein rhm52 [Ophiocordyceps camponoti-floridani]